MTDGSGRIQGVLVGEQAFEGSVGDDNRSRTTKAQSFGKSGVHAQGPFPGHHRDFIAELLRQRNHNRRDCRENPLWALSRLHDIAK